MRTGIFGGTFNPVHNGHIKLAQTYIKGLDLERMLVIPTRMPPHKSGRELADGAHRLAMCRLAFADHPNYIVSDLELTRPEKSYTVDTLKQLQAQYPQDEFYLIMGSDMFETLTEWRNWQEIFALAVICVGARKLNLHPMLERQKQYLEGLGARCRIIDLEPFEVSSTEVRERIRRGEEIGSLVPAPVAEYMERHCLYQGIC